MERNRNIKLTGSLARDPAMPKWRPYSISGDVSYVWLFPFGARSQRVSKKARSGSAVEVDAESKYRYEMYRCRTVCRSNETLALNRSFYVQLSTIPYIYGLFEYNFSFFRF